MKNTINFLITFLLLLNLNDLKAQNWKTTGNNGIDSSNFLGTKNNADLILKTHDITRIIVNKNGNIHTFDTLNADSASVFRGQVLFTGKTGTDGILPEPNLLVPILQDDHWFTTNRYCIMGGHLLFFPFPHWVPNSLIAFGVSTQTPNYMLDVLCNPAFGSKSDINVSTTAATQNVGYRIGGNYVLWHDGNTTDINVGVFAGGTAPGTHSWNTFTGNLAGQNNIADSCTFNGYNAGNGNQQNAATFIGIQSGIVNNGIDNTGVGAWSLFSNTRGQDNTAVGWTAMKNNQRGWYNTAVGSGALCGNIMGARNTAVGYQALYSNTADYNTAVGYQAALSTVNDRNTAIGYQALLSNTQGFANTCLGMFAGYSINGTSSANGSYNTFTGIEDGYNTITGHHNEAYGKKCFYSNKTSSFNTTYGSHNTFSHTNGDSNACFGTFGWYNNVYGTQNVLMGAMVGYNSGVTAYDNMDVMLGARAGYNNPSGNYNIFLGAEADGYTLPVYNPINNAVAIGASALVLHDNNFILGNNKHFVGIGLSGNSVGPQWNLEICTEQNPVYGTGPGGTASTLNGCSATSTGFSGLRFRDLTASSIPCASNPGTGVLAVDANGNVIYVPGGGTGLGSGLCSSLTSIPANGAGYSLSNNPLANFYFDGNSSGFTDRQSVVIGNSCGYTPQGKLDVFQNSTVTTGSTGIYVENDDIAGIGGPNFSIGLKSFMLNNPNANISTLPSIAGWFEANSCPVSSAMCNYAIYVPGYAGPTGNCGGIVSFGFAPPTVGNPTVGQPGGNSYRLQVADGAWCPNWFNSSDRRWKTNLTPVTNAVSMIERIKPYYFFYDTVTYHDLSFPSKQQVGFIGQNVDSVLPQAVSISSNGYYNVDYARMTALLLAGMQQQQGTITRDSMLNASQQSTIDSLRNVLNSISACLSRLCSDTSHHHNSDRMAQNNTNIDLSNSAILYQNTPNPFGENGTKINYFLPENTVGASIVFYDMYGTKLKEVQLTQTGMGTITVNPTQLSNGIYTYSLLINGNIEDTKKMVFAK